ncbi:unnamed protein product [Orchesella dallaii]|uniref:Coiled-coil domain-containing protein 40 n=1 Tax=Orchesella dallaii TaxID=48710 RepID=A0ABP1PT71_9HEXA
MSDSKEEAISQPQKEDVVQNQNNLTDEEEDEAEVTGPQSQGAEEYEDEEETVIQQSRPDPQRGSTGSRRSSKRSPQLDEEEDEDRGEPIPPPLIAAGSYEEDEDGMEPGLMEQMFPEGIGDFEEGDEEGFREKYGLGDILGEIENEDLEEEQENPTNDEDYMGNYEEFLGEDGPEGPTVEQLEAMIKYLDQQKQLAEPKEDNSEDLLPEREVAKRHGRTPAYEDAHEDKENEDDDDEDDANKKQSKMLMVLGPDHPKMVRFQKALKEHLERQVFIVDREMRDLEHELKEKRRERTEMGSAMFNLQNEMLRQTEVMDKYDKDLIKMSEKRTKTEAATEKLKGDLKCLKQELDCEENKERELVQSMKTLDYSEFVVRQAAEKYDGELKIRQLIDDKIEKMKEQSEKQKRDQDYYIDKVMTQIQHMEQINEGIQRQINAHIEEQKQMTTYINEAVTEIEALQIEKIHLQRAWNETISVVRSRDDALVAARKAVSAMEEDLRIKESELRSLVRLITREQETHEQSLVLLRRRRVEEKILSRQVEKFLTKNERLQNKLSELHKIKQTVELELLKQTAAFQKRRKDVNGPRKLIEKLSLEKIRLEDQILIAIQERMAMDKAAEHILGKIKTARDRNRHLDSEVAKTENEMAQLTIDVERLRGDLLRKQGHVDELEKKLAKKEKILHDQLRDIKQSERIIQKKTGEIEHLNKKVQKLIRNQGGIEMGPLEQEMVELQRQIQQEKGNVVQLQEDWLKRQDSLVQLTSQRDAIIHQNEMLRKEVFIMERKRQRLENELEKKKNDVKKLTKATEALRKEIRGVNHRLHKDRYDQEQMDRDNLLIQNELAGLLKDSEMEALELEQEINRLEEDKQRLFSMLHESHEQNLQWEKKVHLAKELKENIKKEQESSLSGLKLAIHHMQVRFNELSRAQEKLMADLERSIDHRDTIIQRADLSLKRANIHPTKTKLNVHRNLSQLQDRNKFLMKEAKEVEGEVKELMSIITEIEGRLNSDADDLSRYRELIQSSESKIHDAAVQKHKNLLEVILRQQKYKVLESVKLQRYKPLARSIDELRRLIEEYENKCYSMVELSDKLTQDHPDTALHSQLVKASILASG